MLSNLIMSFSKFNSMEIQDENRYKASIDDFLLLRVLGKGAYAKVL